MLGFISSRLKIETTSRSTAILTGCAVTAFAAVVAAWLARDTATSLYAKYAYYAAVLLFIFWLGALVTFAQRLTLSAATLRRGAFVATFAALITVLLVASVPQRFRVLSDETNQLSVSQSMILHRTVYDHTMNKWTHTGLQPLSSGLDQRPLMFPFFVHLLHGFRGFHVEHAFWVNAAAMFALLASVGLIVARARGVVTGAGAMVFAATPPIFAIAGTSAGFDFFATAVTTICFVGVYYYWERPDVDRFAVLTANLVLLMNIRYESALLALAVLGGLWIAGKLPFRHIAERPWFYGAAMLLLLPLAVQRIVTSVGANTPNGIPSFHVEHLWRWTKELVVAQFRWDETLPYAWAMNWIAAGILGYLVFYAWLRRRSEPLRWSPTLIVGVALALHTTLILSFYSSSYTHAASERYFILVSMAATLSPLLLMRAGFASWPFTALAAIVFFVYHPIAVQDVSSSTLVAVRQFDYQRRLLSAIPAAHTLVIAARPGQVSALGYGAVDFGYANNRRFELAQEIGSKRYAGAYVFQRLSARTGQPIPADQLDAAYPLEPIAEAQMTNDETLRLSCIKF